MLGTNLLVGCENIVDLVTRYRLDGPGVNSRWGEDICIHPDWPWDPPSLLYDGYRVSFPCVKPPGCGVDHPPHLAPRLKKE